MLMIFVDDLDARVAEIADRGLEPWKRETYDNGVRKITYRDAGLVARPTGVGRGITTYRIAVEGRDEWLAAAEARSVRRAER